MNAMKSLIPVGFVLVIMQSGLAAAPPARPIDLTPFLGKSQFQTIGADWILPRGRQVVEGVPFQVDGVVEVAGASARFSNVGRTNVNDIPIGATFDRLYLLAAASRDVNEGTPLARLKLKYADGLGTDVVIEYGRHVADWMGPRHKGESPLIEPDARVAWQVEHPAAARRDDSLRLFYFTLANPDPTREVRSLSVVSARARGGFMLAALTVGPERVERQPDTLARIEEHFHIEGAPGGKPALTGRVIDEANQPVTNAMVRVLSVKTVDPTDALTPEDSQGAGREAKTDAAGRWRLPELSERLLYRILVAAPGMQSAFFDGADPLAGPANLQLKSGNGQTGEYLVKGRVVGPDGKPIVGASVKPDGVGTGMSTSWGGNMGFPSELITGLNGEFIMAREQPFTRMSVDITAAGLAPRKVWLPVSNGVHTVELGVGAVVTGRVLKNGRPLADVEVGVSGANRSSEVFAGHHETKTDADGRFRLERLPPNTQWYFYGLMRSLRRDGSLSPRQIATSGHGEVTELGDLTVQRSVTLSGQVKVSAGESLPANARITANYDSAWDSQSARIDRATGQFELTGLHPGTVQLYLNASSGSSAWVPTAENRSIDEWNPQTLAGVLTEDKRDLLIVVAKQERVYNSYSGNNGYLPDVDRARNLPLAGAESSGPPAIVLAGQIVDDASGEPVRVKARITPGRKPPSPTPVVVGGGLVQTLVEAFRPRTVPWNERPYWENNRITETFNGRFSIPFRPLTSVPMLRIEADGYHPLETAPMPTSETNLTLRLKKGTGPKGILLGIDGKPAAGVNVFFGAEQEQFSIEPTGEIRAYGNPRATAATGPDGSFAFASKPNGRRVFAANEEGWLSVAIADWPSDGRLRLTAWAQARGTLLEADGKPALNTQVAIESVRNYQEGDAWANFQERPTVDANGRFAFQRVPPGDVRLVHLVPMNNGGGGWMHALQTNFTAQPGKSVDLGTMKKTPHRF